LSAEKLLAEEFTQEIQTNFRRQTVPNNRCFTQPFPNDNAPDIHQNLLLKLGFCNKVWLAVGPILTL
jgi:hypothetical protein